MSNRKYARNPMLYIEQPDNKNPRATMQHDYRTKKISSGIKNRNFLDEEREARQKEESVEFEEEEPEEKQEIVLPEESRKKFNDRTLEEKINYFAEAPEYAPKRKCEIKTEKKTYRGIITERDDEHVYIRVGNRARAMKIMIHEIKNIRLLGFS